jgi:hypothetical protein
MPLPEVLIAYGTWRSRLVPAQPRRCHESVELATSDDAKRYRLVLDAIKRKIEIGEDIRAHLSTGIDRGLGVDRMLADVGVHHLHLSLALRPDGRYVIRSSGLLFVVFRPEDAYLVGIYEHVTDWADRDILERIVRNWPDVGIVPELNYARPRHEWTDKAERLAMQKAGIAAGAVEVDGRCFMPLGQGLTGTPYAAHQLRMRVMEAFRQWRETLPEHLADASRAVDAAAGRAVTGDWQPAVHEGFAGIVRGGIFCPIVTLS